MNKLLLILVLTTLIVPSAVSAMNNRLDDLSNQNLSDLSGVEFKQTATRLRLDDNQITSFDGAQFPPNLRTISADNNQITQISNLPEGLTFLSLDDNQLTNLNNLPSTLNIFVAKNNSISSIQGVEATPGLSSLRVDDNQITDISIIQNLQQLENISFNDNNVANIDFPWPKTVEDINFSNNAIEDISPLTEITALEDLFALGGEITDIPDFSQSNNLKFISLTGHPFTELNCNFIPSSVRELNLPRNEISTIIDPCEITNPKLKKLDMASNNLTEINMTLRRARKLRTIDLSSNDLTSLENLTIKPRRASFKLDVRDNGNLPQSEIKAFKRRHPNARVKSGGFF